MAESTPRSQGFTRRAALVGSAIGVGSALLATTPASAAPNYSVIPKLPYEISRLDTVYSKFGRRPYEIIDISLAGDKARLFVPHSAKPSRTIGRGFIWFYHANGSNYAALSGAFQYSADQAVDRGVISICPNYAGDGWVSPAAITAQANVVKWVTSQWKVSVSFLRSNSGGGALMCWAYGKRLVPNIRGAYMASGAYDVEDTLQRDPLRVLPAYGNDASKVPPTNPARLPQSVWAKTRLRITGATDDQVVPIELHGGRLHQLALPVAKETSIVYHSSEGNTWGHIVPSFTNKDMVDTFARWLSEGPA